jgi:hypothetical protein
VKGSCVYDKVALTRIVLGCIQRMMLLKIDAGLPHAPIYLPKYEKSHALIIGINAYENVGPLLHATNDANAVAKTLLTKFDFATENVRVLLDSKATRDQILTEFMRLADPSRMGCLTTESLCSTRVMDTPHLVGVVRLGFLSLSTQS